MKGIVQIILVAAAALILVGGFYLNSFIGITVNIKETAKEMEIIKAVNRMEAVKRGLPYSLFYSYSEAMKRNGYSYFSDVKDEDEFKREISSVFDEYRDEINEQAGIAVPSGDFDLSSVNEEVTVSFTSTGFLTCEYSSPELSFRITDNPNATIKIVNEKLVE